MKTSERIKQAAQNIYEKTLWQNPLQDIVEKYYSRKISPGYAKLLSSVSDATKFKLDNVVTGTLISLPVLEAYTKISRTLHMSPQIRNFVYRLEDDIREPYVWATSTILTLAIAYFANGLRKQMFSKLGLKMNPVTDKERENNMTHCEKNIRLNLNSEPVSLEETVETLTNELDLLTAKIDSVKVKSPKRIKSLNCITKSIGAIGSFNPITYEIETTRGTLYDSHIVAHELSHSKGYPRESECEFLAYLAGINSPHRTHRLQAYTERLVRELQSIKQSPEKKIERILKMNLPDDFKAKFIKNFVGGKGIPVLSDIFSKIQDVILRIEGERHGRGAYSKGFTELLTAFERKHGRDGMTYFETPPQVTK